MTTYGGPNTHSAYSQIGSGVGSPVKIVPPQEETDWISVVISLVGMIAFASISIWFWYQINTMV